MEQKIRTQRGHAIDLKEPGDAHSTGYFLLPDEKAILPDVFGCFLKKIIDSSHVSRIMTIDILDIRMIIVVLDIGMGRPYFGEN